MRRGVSTVFCALIHIVLVQCYFQNDPHYWSHLASEELQEALNAKFNLNKAKNVILFIGDSMGPNTVTATRIHKGGESHKLAFETFPHVGLIKTYSANMMVADSSSTATALLCGAKVNSRTVAVDSSVQPGDCAASLNPRVQLDSMAALALKAKKSAGFVTTMRVMHSTPSPVFAHSAHRGWECDASLPAEAAQCKDIARQLIEDFPGRDLNVIMGGGRQSLITGAVGTPEDPLNRWTCSRQDGRNLFDVYKMDKQSRGKKYSIISNNRELRNLDVDNTDYLLGIFANENLPFENKRNPGPEGMPSISEMVEGAIKVLRKNENGFFLMVEGGNIDMAHHRGRAKVAIDETATMEEAVKLAIDMTDEEDTLIVVTGSHDSTMTINGYPERGANIFGTVGPSRFDGLNYTILSYGTGGPGSHQRSVGANGQVVREDPSTVDTNAWLYEQISAIQLEENSHGGGDVAIYAKGPYAHLFHSVHEQHYIFHVMAYAAKLGPYAMQSTPRNPYVQN